jgi:hypothetical protein
VASQAVQARPCQRQQQQLPQQGTGGAAALLRQQGTGRGKQQQLQSGCNRSRGHGTVEASCSSQGSRVADAAKLAVMLVIRVGNA